MAAFRSLQNTPEHLPPERRESLQAITEALRALAPVGMVILFGSHARGEQVSDAETGYASDFDLLVVVADEAVAEDIALWSRAAEQAKALAGGVPVQLIVHDVRYLNAEIRLGNYFFVDILREGVLLFDAHSFHLAKPKALTRAEMLSVAEHNFTYWYGSASVFLQNCRYCAAHGQRAEAAFLLHQATERYYHAVLLVFTAYKPRTHNLAELGERAEAAAPSLAGALARTGTAEDVHLFDLLKRAYIDARYSKGYRITDAELGALEGRVRELARRIRAACVERMESIAGAGAVRGDLPRVPASGEALLEALPRPEEPGAWEGWTMDLIALSKGEGRAEGLTEGLAEGERKGLTEGRVEGLAEGERKGLAEGLAEGERKGLAEGRAEGRALGKAEAVLAVLVARGIAVDDAVRARVLSCRDDATLVAWLVRAATATSAAGVVDSG